MESKEIMQRSDLVVKEKVSSFIEAPEKMKPVLEEFKRVVRYELPEGLHP